MTDLQDVMNKTLISLKDAGMLLPDTNDPSCLRILMSGDKGSDSIKILSQILNIRHTQSIKATKLIGIFEGCKDNRANVEFIFGPIFKSLANLLIADVDTQVINEHELETLSNELKFFQPNFVR